MTGAYPRSSSPAGSSGAETNQANVSDQGYDLDDDLGDLGELCTPPREYDSDRRRPVPSVSHQVIPAPTPHSNDHGSGSSARMTSNTTVAEKEGGGSAHRNTRPTVAEPPHTEQARASRCDRCNALGQRVSVVRETSIRTCKIY